MAEEQVKPESQTEGTEGESKASKRKKINKLSLKEIDARIEDLSKASHILSKYYQHLVQRKNEMQSSGNKVSA